MKKTENRKEEHFLSEIFNNGFVKKILLAALLVVFLGITYRMLWKKVIFPNFFDNKEGKVTTISKATLINIFETNDLAVLKNYYNSYAAVYDEDGETVKYYVAYEGTIRMGIDFEKVQVKKNKKKKWIKILLPKAEIQDINVDTDSMEYIFKSGSYETETVSGEAFQECNKDLQKKAENAEELLEQAGENAKDAVNAFVQPLKESLGENYKVMVEVQESR